MRWASLLARLNLQDVARQILALRELAQFLVHVLWRHDKAGLMCIDVE